MKKAIYTLTYICWYTLSLLPLKVLYILSNLLYYLITYVVRYRRKIILRNLTLSFPEKSPQEINQLLKSFYAFFSDYMVETLKLMSISPREMKRRMRFKGVDKVEAECMKGHSAVIFLGHYCNWEWVSSLGLHTDYQCGQIYHPLQNQLFDRLFLTLRGRGKAHSIPMEDTFTQMRQWAKEGRIHIVGFIADQAPLYSSIHHFSTFFNQDTPVLTGGERIARVMDCSVFYLDVSRPKRGYYEAQFIKITDSPKSEPLFSITDRYFELLEASIRRAPQFWLWSHNRWKRTRKEFMNIYGEEDARKRLSRL